jgi:outer membrane lipoprotein SlyB
MPESRRLAGILTALSLVLAACSHPSGQQYTAQDAGRILDTATASVISSRPVEIRGGENVGIGAVAGGAAAGSVAAAAVDKPGAEAAATIIAGLVGAGLGFLAEEEARSRDGIEYVLRTSDGRVITLVQNRGANEEVIPAGREVLIQYGSQYTRVVPLPEGAAPAQSAPRESRDYNGLDTGRGVAPASESADEDAWSDPDAGQEP